MEKRVILERLLERLRAELVAAHGASKDAAAYATDDEARARSKWETQGLEASYLAAGQAGHARELAEAITKLKGRLDELARPSRLGELGALMTCELEGELDRYLLAPVGGGETVEADGHEITVITPGSPLFASLRGRQRGERIRLPSGASLLVKQVE